MFGPLSEVEIPSTGTDTGSNSNNSNTDTESTQTGDNNNILLWIALLFVGGAGIVGTTVYNKKKSVKAK